MKISYEYNPYEQISTCTISYKDKIFVGIAKCHPEDEDMVSERVGAVIAESRASIKYFQYLKEKTKHQLEILYHLLTYRNKEQKRTKEQKQIYKLYTKLQKEIIFFNERIELEKKLLKEYINEKDKVFKKLREKENKQ